MNFKNGRPQSCCFRTIKARATPPQHSGRLPKHAAGEEHDDDVSKVQGERKYNHSKKRQNIDYQSSLSKTKQKKG